MYLHFVKMVGSGEICLFLTNKLRGAELMIRTLARARPSAVLERLCCGVGICAANGAGRKLCCDGALVQQRLPLVSCCASTQKAAGSGPPRTSGGGSIQTSTQTPAARRGRAGSVPTLPVNVDLIHKLQKSTSKNE